MFETAAKRVTKMTEKAKAALQTSSKKRKNDTSSISGGPNEPKKAKPNPLSGNSKDRSTEPLSPSPPTSDVIQVPKPQVVQSHRAIIRTEEEEAAMYEDAIDISNQGSSDGDEPLHEEESAKDELSELY
jgi:hypothetical protein